jgi:hypothetical protein
MMTETSRKMGMMEDERSGSMGEHWVQRWVPTKCARETRAVFASGPHSHAALRLYDFSNPPSRWRQQTSPFVIDFNGLHLLGGRATSFCVPCLFGFATWHVGGQ